MIMKKYMLWLLMCLFTGSISFSQPVLGTANTPGHSIRSPYHGERPRINDLIHTDIHIRPRFSRHTVEGNTLIRLRPHFYPVDSLVLDAKSMKIHSLKVQGQQAPYHYDGRQIHIRLPRRFYRHETYEVEIAYTAYPDSVPKQPGTVITDNRGFYFIDEKPGIYPAQFWTQGEPESNSVWFPTIDSPNQKSTEKLSITLPAAWISLSNGTKISSTNHPDGTRTDVWEQDKPHAPYLFFVAGGPFVQVRDSLGRLPVNYYVEKKYAPVARQIFGKTPEMIAFYSRLTGVPYPWDKYSQIVTRKFVSGAMENTTAVNHSDMAYQDAAALIDENHWEDVIAHELFHHWFGDYVTAESWAQIAMNESFADYGEALWEEHDEGPDMRDYKVEQDWKAYLMMPGNYRKPLVRYHYRRPDDVFDGVSYQKGGVILHFLRHMVGDSAFFAGLRRYLTTNAYATAEADRLRLAMEEVSGQDLKPFFDSWFYGSGHPRFDIHYAYHDHANGGKVEVIITQHGTKTWSFPLDIDVYEGTHVSRHHVRVTDSVQHFSFPYRRRPSLVNVDAGHVVPSVTSDHRADSTYYFQYFHAPGYPNRNMGLNKAIAHQQDKTAFSVVAAALDDPFYILRIRAIDAIDPKSPYFNKRIEKKLVHLARYDRRTLVQAAALRKLDALGRRRYVPLFAELVHSPSKAVSETAFYALMHHDPRRTLRLIEQLSPGEKQKLGLPIAAFYVSRKTPGKETFVASQLFNNIFDLMGRSYNARTTTQAIEWITKGDNVEANRILADKLLKLAGKYDMTGFKNMVKMMFRSFIRNQSANTGPHHDQIISIYRQALESLSQSSGEKTPAKG